ncbi:hypothetical protein LEP1GSC193_4351 [Leptospira alstonii serovar Pingchang str. 80-412]|uniref:Uncharacterized protein n=1 Tax=Leptospira alstonii serovar Pingchang str. 80-412 TaxID=1218564 RepID=T0G058_9LEPT|nr:hypothetical protein [Leptospira alstonii]EQA80281.1 hypothetical protein LEP1GSC193_4351 [Leptospira alstonii serovar Pingchang str. 80-412]
MKIDLTRFPQVRLKIELHFCKNRFHTKSVFYETQAIRIRDFVLYKNAPNLKSDLADPVYKVPLSVKAN